MKCYDYRKKASSSEELQFSEATLVNIALDNPATNTLGALVASLLISSHIPLSGPLPKVRAGSRSPTRDSVKQTQSLCSREVISVLEQESGLHFECGSAAGFVCSLHFGVMRLLDHLAVPFVAASIEHPSWL